MTLYDIMYEAINDKYENGEITFEQANELNVIAYDKYITEKKTKAEYRIQKFKKDFKYDPKEKSIEVNGERIPFNLKANTSKKYNSEHTANINGANEITMNRHAFNGKHPKGYKFTIGHEYGHSVARRMSPEEKEKEFDKYTDHSNAVKKQLIYNTDHLMNVDGKKEERDNWDKSKKEYLKNLSKINMDQFHDAKKEEYYADDWGKKIAGEEVSKKTLKDLKKYLHKVENNADYENKRKDWSDRTPSERIQKINQDINLYKGFYKDTNTDKQREFLDNKIKEFNDEKKKIRSEARFNKKNLHPVYRADGNRLVETGMGERIKNVSSNKKK